MKPNDEPLLDLVFNRLAGDEVPDGTATLVLAAYAGKEQLRAALAGDSPDLPVPGGEGQARIDPLSWNRSRWPAFAGSGRRRASGCHRILD